MKRFYYTLSAIFTMALTGLIAATDTAQSQSLSSATCSSPTVVATFASQVTGVVTGATDTFGSASATQSIPSTGLTALKFKKCGSCSETVDLDIYNGVWSSNNTVYTVYPTLKNYRDANQWDVWPVQLTATASGTASTVTCQ